MQIQRLGVFNRATAETKIELQVDLDGTGKATVDTGVGFLDHMLQLFAHHSRFDLTIQAHGDRHIDDHHTVEDVGLCLGSAISKAIGDKRGLQRYGHFTLPMDESLVTVAVDLSDRPICIWHVKVPAAKVGSFDTELAEEFWRAVANQGRLNFHAVLLHGSNSHHILEALYKAAGRAFRQAVTIDPRLENEIPSTKQTL